MNCKLRSRKKKMAREHLNLLLLLLSVNEEEGGVVLSSRSSR